MVSFLVTQSMSCSRLEEQLFPAVKPESHFFSLQNYIIGRRVLKYLFSGIFSYLSFPGIIN